MAEHSELSSGAKYIATRKDRRRSRTQIYAYEEQDSFTLFQSRDHSRSRQRNLVSESSSYWKPVSGFDSTRMSVTPRIVTQMLRLSSVDPYDLPKHESGDSDTGGTLQPLMQFAPRRTIVHSTKDHAIGQLKSIDESVYRRQYRYLKRCYQGIAQESIVTNTLGLNDGAITTDLRLSTDREGNSQPPATARRYRGLLNCTNPIAAPQISPLSPIPTTRPKPGSLAPSSKCDASYFSIRYCGVSNPDRLAMPSTNPRHRRTASSGTTVFTPPLIATASPKSEKSGTAQSSSSDSSGWSKEQMSFL